jgi:protein phosphatase/serine/threonine-protein phosphatase Stp1
VTHVGRVRKINGGSVSARPDHRIWAVADGMGGHAAGDFASQTVVGAIAAIPPDLPPADMMNALRDAILRAHEMIKADTEARGLGVVGSTVVSLILADGHFAAFWAGDSRLYSCRNGKLDLLTVDHSLVGDMVLAGTLTWDEAEHHPQANIITRAVGVGEGLDLEKVRGDARPGDRFLLCSDGLSKHADFARLESMLSNRPLDTVAQELIDQALDSGGDDNISVIVVDVV